MKTSPYLLLLSAALWIGACTSAAAPQPAQTSQAYPAPTQADSEAGSPATTLYRIVPGESSVTYEVGETFINRNNQFNVAIGVTGEVNGEISVDTKNPQNSVVGVISVDISQFTSDSSRRDRTIRERFLESGKYPLAIFTPTALHGLPETYTPGQPVTFEIRGDLTVHQSTRPVTFQVEASLQDGTLSGTAQTTLLMSDFGIGPISIAGILKTQDEVKVRFTFVARP